MKRDATTKQNTVDAVPNPINGRRQNRGPIAAKLNKLQKLFGKVAQVAHKFLTSPATRSHILAILQSEGPGGIIRRLRRMRTNLSRMESTDPRLQIKPLTYDEWSARFDTPNEDDNEAMCDSIANKCIHLVLLVENDDLIGFDQTIQSIQSSSRKPNKLDIVFADTISDDNRASMLARANTVTLSISSENHSPDCTILVRAGDALRSHAIALLAAEFVRSPHVAFLYADEARDINGEMHHWFKPDYAPLMAQTGHLLTGPVAFNHQHANAAGLIDAVRSSSYAIGELLIDWSTQQPRMTIGHLPHVLSVTSLTQPSIRHKLPQSPSLPIVSIIIPTRNFWSVLKPCLDSLKTTHWPLENLDVIVVDNGSDDPETLRGLAERCQAGEIRVVQHNSTFNWSELNNIGAMHARGSVLVFLNNDIEVIQSDWLEKLVAYACLPQAGAVGCKLLYPDRTVQHGGVIIGILGGAGHAHLSLHAEDGGYNGLANLTHEVSAVTGACIAVEKAKFDRVGGFDENFAVAFNDIAFCIKLSQAGLDNIYVADATLLHHESKSRGYDTTPEKIERNRNEMIQFWEKYRDFIRDDVHYSPNLSYREPYKLGSFPRRKPLWTYHLNRKPRVLMLSTTHAKGHGVPVVLAKQAEALVSAGFEVMVVGPKSENDFGYEGCQFLEAHDAEAAALAAIIFRADCVVAHTPPFFSTVRWLGSDCPFMAYDYGEPPADWFEDRATRQETLWEKDISFSMADRVYAISEAIRDERAGRYDGIIPLGNSHLGQWTDESEKRRQALRQQFNWTDHFVILNVCRFHRGERRYKGINLYVDMMRRFRQDYPELAANCIFVLCGKGTPKDIEDMEKEGLTVFPNVTDETMIEIYLAADAYVNFSQWEGYNLGIAQALAMGLPTFASDIPAHRAFGIPVSNTMIDANEWAAEQIKTRRHGREPRTPKIWPWEPSLHQFTAIIANMIETTTADRR